MRALIAAGATAEMLVAAAEAEEAEEAERVATKRAKDAERKRRSRTMSVMSRGHGVTDADDTGHAVTACDPTPLVPPLSSAPTPPTNNPPYNPPTGFHSLPSEAHSPTIDAEAPKRTQGRTLPEDWAPNDKHRTEADALGRDDVWLTRQAEAMRTWAISNRNRQVARKADWDLTFLGWIRREHEKNPIAQPRASPAWAPVDTKGALERAMAKAGVRQ